MHKEHSCGFPRALVTLCVALMLMGPGCSDDDKPTGPGPPPAPDGFVLIPAGTFTMGSPEDEPGHWIREIQRQVTLTRTFYIGIHEVTQAEWQSTMGWNNSYSIGRDKPVELVTWFDAVIYCNRRSDEEGLTRAYTISDTVFAGRHARSANVTWDQSADGFRLPTSAEWEYACRAGAGTAFANGPLIHSRCEPLDPNLDQMGWYCGNAGRWLHPVGLKSPNTWGLYDMHGGVKEWCWDYTSRESDSEPVTDPTGPESGIGRILRGGSYLCSPIGCRSAFLGGQSPGAGAGGYGLRLVRTVFRSDAM